MFFLLKKDNKEKDELPINYLINIKAQKQEFIKMFWVNSIKQKSPPSFYYKKKEQISISQQSQIYKQPGQRRLFTQILKYKQSTHKSSSVPHNYHFKLDNQTESSQQKIIHQNNLSRVGQKSICLNNSSQKKKIRYKTRQDFQTCRLTLNQPNLKAQISQIKTNEPNILSVQQLTPQIKQLDKIKQIKQSNYYNRRNSCVCCQCGRLNKFQNKYQDLSSLTNFQVNFKRHRRRLTIVKRPRTGKNSFISQSHKLIDYWCQKSDNGGSKGDIYVDQIDKLGPTRKKGRHQSQIVQQYVVNNISIKLEEQNSEKLTLDNKPIISKMLNEQFNTQRSSVQRQKFRLNHFLQRAEQSCYERKFQETVLARLTQSNYFSISKLQKTISQIQADFEQKESPILKKSFSISKYQKTKSQIQGDFAQKESPMLKNCCQLQTVRSPYSLISNNLKTKRPALVKNNTIQSLVLQKIPQTQETSPSPNLLTDRVFVRKQAQLKKIINLNLHISIPK